MTSLNRQRANLVFSHLLAYDKVLTPKQVARAERIFEKDGVLRWTGGQSLGFARIGVGLADLCVKPQGQSSAKSAAHESMPSLSRLLECFQNEKHILSIDKTSRTIMITLKTGCTSSNQLKAWLHALILAKDVCDTSSDGTKGNPDTKPDTLKAITSSLTRANNFFSEYSMRLQSAGWVMDAAVLETRCGPRITYAK
jgi:hypothetical protein